MTKTSYQDVCRIHPNVRLGGQVFGKPMRRKEPGNQLAIAKGRYAQTRIIPVPGETQSEDKRLFQGLKIKRKGEELMGDTEFAPTRADLNGDFVCITDLLPPAL